MKVLLTRNTVQKLVGKTFPERLDNELKAIGGIKLLGVVKVNDSLEFISVFILVLGLLLGLGIVSALQGQNPKMVILISMGAVLLMAGQYANRIKNYRETIMLDNELPAVIETLAIGINAGKSLDSTLRYIVQNKKGLVRNLLAEAILMIDGGEKIDDALNYAAGKSLTRRFEQIVRLVMESKNSTAKLKELLLEQAEEIQEEKLNQKLDRAAKLETKLFFPIFAGYFIPVLVLAAYPVLADFKGFF